MNIECPHCRQNIARATRTEKQARVLAYIIDFTQRKGHMPSVRQVGQHLGVTGPTVQGHINALRSQGFLTDTPTGVDIERVTQQLEKNLNGES